MLTLLRRVIQLLSIVSPSIAANLAFRLFCTPIAPKSVSGRQQTLINTARQRLDEQEPKTVSVATGKVSYYEFNAQGNTRGTVALVHGWTSESAFMLGFVDVLNAAGFHVVAFDLPAHGRSEGKRLILPTAVDALLAVESATGPWQFAIAHSFGSAVTLTAMSGLLSERRQLSLQRLVLLAAPNTLTSVFNGFGCMVGLTANAQAHFNAKVEQITGQPLEAFDGRRVLEELKLPTLVVHDPADREVSFSAAEQYQEAGTHISLLALENLGHRRLLYDPTLIQRVTDYLKEDEPQPSALESPA